MPMPGDFAEEGLYTADSWFVHDVLEVDENHVKVRIDTTQLGPLVAAQRVVPGHPKHFPGAVAIQVTGTLGQLHAVYGRGLRATEGWAGFGTHIKNARFPSMGEIGPEVIAEATCTKFRKFRGTWFGTYQFRFTQGDRVIYESEQSAGWHQLKDAAPESD